MFKNLFAILNVFLITLLIFFGIKLCYQILSAKLLELSSPDLMSLVAMENYGQSAPPSANRLKTKNLMAYQSITDRDLFKTSEHSRPKAPATDIELEKLRKTSLKLTLYGTIIGTDGVNYAVIEDMKQHKQGLYKIGDAIQDAKIKLILRKKVVLNVNGKDEILLMEDDKKKVARRPSTRFQPEEEPYGRGEGFDVGETVSIDRETINDSLKNINQLMSQVKVRPHFKDGKPDGLLLSHVRRDSIFKDMGLQNGDIVKGVNGKKIQSVDDALKFYDNLKSSSSVELQIERKGEMMSINYNIE